jgi:hypothetical protein
MTTLELDEKRILNNVIFEPIKKGNEVVYTFVYKPKADNQFSFIAQYDASFTQLINVENISRITITINSSVVFDGTVLSTPLNINANDVINVRVYKSFLTVGKFILIGTTTS